VPKRNIDLRLSWRHFAQRGAPHRHGCAHFRWTSCKRGILGGMNHADLFQNMRGLERCSTLVVFFLWADDRSCPMRYLLDQMDVMATRVEKLESSYSSEKRLCPDGVLQLKSPRLIDTGKHFGNISGERRGKGVGRWPDCIRRNPIAYPTAGNTCALPHRIDGIRITPRAKVLSQKKETGLRRAV